MNRNEQGQEAIQHGVIELSDMDVDAVAGGARLSVQETKKIELAARLERSYAETHPFDYYGYFG
jgi:hypothetical protein